VFGPSRTDPDLTPLPVWRQHLARYRDTWRRSKDRRKAALAALQSAVTLGLSLAFSGAGATLISYGVWEMHRPAGYITGGLMCWLLQWSRERDRGRVE
jgi:hypothetical protein